MPIPAIRLLRTSTALVLVCVLAACGGGNEASGHASTVTDRTGSEGVVFEAASGAPPAWLNARSLQDAEAHAKEQPAPLEKIAPGQIAAWDDYANGNVARKATAVRIPVYRFYNGSTGAHFYTTSETEKANILATMPQFAFDGPAFEAASEAAPGLSPVYRFYNSATGVHFYTISETEKTTVLATLPQFQLEGTAYHASQVAGQGLTPLYRFYLPAKGYHFYTASATERDSIQSTLSGTYSYEGIGYYVPSSAWNADKLPHTGLSADQCYGRNLVTSTDFFGTCGATLATLPLYVQQDSVRTAHNPMSYGPVTRLSGTTLVTEPKTSCVQDQVTGLYWEGKTDDGGLRDKDHTYTSQGGGAATDTSGYVAAVNASTLCGFTDWRVPTVLELATLNHYGLLGPPPFVDATWFPNTVASFFWSSEAASATEKWVLANDSYRWDVVESNVNAWPVRLVRGNMGNVSGGRYSYSTMVYGTDGANNVVSDKLTGLQWRRCLEGQVWSGSACTGTATTYTHREALLYANGSGLRTSGWRIPNVKEGASLLDKSQTSAPYADRAAFPGAPGTDLWTSTAAVGDPADAAYMGDPLNFAYSLSMDGGWLEPFARSSHLALRLVR
ncbi:DUF1566 domain-containing protein [Hydrogenophaga sp. RWCD_12]|uniref:DUF1566 domain-containing protein n=1 Tax=Hydrogenophaga sp. RWCD_12 TaxID=3391190 RepID=UPI003984689C